MVDGVSLSDRLNGDQDGPESGTDPNPGAQGEAAGNTNVQKRDKTGRTKSKKRGATQEKD